MAQDVGGWLRRRPLVMLSPHPDDLCYSLGALLARRDCTRDLAVVAFTVSRFTPGMARHRGDPLAVTALRRDEDVRYMDSLGVARVDLGLDDCTVRSACWRDWVQVSCSAAVDACLQAAIRSALRARPDARVLAPLGLGGNKDHLAVRDAALRTVSSNDLVLYEDLPYAAGVGLEGIASYVRQIAPRFGSALAPMRESIGHKLAMAAVSYPSQLRQSDTDAFARHAVAVGGTGPPAERVWILREHM